VLFVDLIKAFDTANQKYLFATIPRLGAPEKLMSIIQRLHTNFKLHIALDKEKTSDIPSTVGVKQGVNMAPTLFLPFLMRATIESLHINKKVDNKLPFRNHANPAGRRKSHGRLHLQSLSEKKNQGD
jgi:hypothetical protein